jgi:hypothetical protein
MPTITSSYQWPISRPMSLFYLSWNRRFDSSSPRLKQSHQMDFDFSDLLENIVDEPPNWPLAPPAGFSEYAPPAGFSGTGNPYAYSDTSTSLNYQPIFDIHSHNQSATSFSSNNTGRTGTAGPSATSTSSLSVPEAFAAQLSSLDLSSGLLPVFRTLCSHTPPPLASQESFLRKFPVWKPHLSPILDVAVSLAFRTKKSSPLMTAMAS